MLRHSFANLTPQVVGVGVSEMSEVAVDAGDDAFLANIIRTKIGLVQDMRYRFKNAPPWIGAIR